MSNQNRNEENFAIILSLWYDLKDQFPTHLILIRRNDQYVSFYEHAQKAGKLMELEMVKQGELLIAFVPAHSIDYLVEQCAKITQGIALCEPLH